jgi:hypothetical protein
MTTRCNTDNTTEPERSGFFVPGAFVTATATPVLLQQPEHHASAGFDQIGGKRHTLLLGNNAHIKNRAGL